MLAKVLLVSSKNQYIKLQLVDGRIVRLPLQHARFAKRGDICELSEYRGRTKLNLLTDADESVKMHQMVPYKYASGVPVTPPTPIITP